MNADVNVIARESAGLASQVLRLKPFSPIKHSRASQAAAQGVATLRAPMAVWTLDEATSQIECRGVSSDGKAARDWCDRPRFERDRKSVV